MKTKQIVRLGTDVAMTVGLLLLMGYDLWGETFHEWVGAGVFLLFILHHILNARWWTGLFSGRYTAVRVLQTVTDLLVLAAMLGLMASGVLLSGRVFVFLHLRGPLALGRRLHMAASHWGFLLMSAHLGLHWSAVLAAVKKALPPKRPASLLPTILGALPAAWGVVAMVRRDFGTCLFLRAEFIFLDFGESKVLFYLDYIAIMATFVFLFHFAAKLLRRYGGRRPE